MRAHTAALPVGQIRLAGELPCAYPIRILRKQALDPFSGFLLGQSFVERYLSCCPQPCPKRSVNGIADVVGVGRIAGPVRPCPAVSGTEVAIGAAYGIRIRVQPIQPLRVCLPQ